MAHELTPAEKKARRERTNALADRVRGHVSDGFREAQADLDLAELREEVAGMVVYLKRVFIDAFGAEDGKRMHAALLDGSLEGIYAELAGDLLDERRIKPLADRTVAINDLVTSATTVLNETTFMLGGASDHPVRLIKALLDAEDAGDWRLVDDLEADFSCEIEEEPAWWRAKRSRARRERDRRNPEAARERRARPRRQYRDEDDYDGVVDLDW